MKKIISTLLSLLICHTLYSLPIGNPAEPMLYSGSILPCELEKPCFCWLNDWHVRTGYYGDFVFNRNLAVNDPILPQGHIIGLTQIRTNAGYLALNINDMLDIFTTLGASRIRIETNELSWGSNATFDGILSTDTHFSWSVGGRLAILSWRCFTLGFEGQYFRTSPFFIDYFSANGGNRIYFNSNNRIHYNEWQVGGGLSYVIRTECPDLAVTPYIGVKWARVHLNTHGFNFNSPDERLTIFNLISHKRWGYAVGATFSFCNCIGFTAEGRFGDEKALYINGQISF